MDVKVGSGAFLPSLEAARELARTLVEVANGAGLRCSALLTDMSQCLGRTAGNALEVREAIDVLTGQASTSRLREVTLALAAELLVLGGLAEDEAAAAAAAARALDSGAAAERFARMVVALGGPADLLERPDRHLPEAPVRHAVHLERAGVVAAIDARALGLAVVGLGGGRRRVTDPIDPRVGLAEVRGHRRAGRAGCAVRHRPRRDRRRRGGRRRAAAQRGPTCAKPSSCVPPAIIERIAQNAIRP